MAKEKAEKEIIRMCGWCMTGHHKGCNPKIEFYDKVWLCYCRICHPELEEGKND